jgi:hypothetical protein
MTQSGYEAEIAWQESRDLENLTERSFLRETAWVILSSGMRESVVKRVFPNLEDAFLGFESANLILRNAERCQVRARQIFNHQGKISGIIKSASLMAPIGFDKFVLELKREGIPLLKQFPYIGPITCFHLAKNIGLDVAKPDRHLERLARSANYPCTHSLCEAISSITGDRVSVVDLVLWRYIASDPRRTALFA